MKNTIKGLLIFLTLSAVSILAVSLIYQSPPNFSNLTLQSILIAAAIAISSLYFEIEKVRVIGLTIKTKIPFKAAAESVMGREFLSAITPFGGGGQPLEVFILNKYGLKVGQAMTVAYLETFTTILILLVAGLTSLFLYRDVLESHAFKGFLIFSVGAMVYFFLFFYFSVFKPKILKKVSFFFINLLGKIKIIKKDTLYRAKKRVVKEIAIFNNHIKMSFKAPWYLFVLLLLLTLIFWVIRFIAIYPIFLILGSVKRLSLFKLLAYQMIITFVNYFVFTPGSSGTTEWIGAILFKPFLNNPDHISTFIVLWRFFSFHILVLFCGMVIFKVVKLFSQKKG